MDWLKQYKWYISSGILVSIIVIIYIVFNQSSDIEVIEAVDIELDNLPEEEINVEEEIQSTVFVEVKGAVKSPGVYELAKDARVINVLNMAELLTKSDLMSVNQSQKIYDEMVIYVPYEGEDLEVDYGSGSNGDSNEETVNINTAAVSDLTKLNGIGEKKAALIIEYRELNGLFMKKEDLMNITGIGEKTFESLESYITID